MHNAMTVDVEDYFQVQAFAHCIDRSDWDAFPRRVDLNTDRILDQFDAAGVKATFFTLGWVAERFPGLDPPDRRGRARTGEPWLGSHPGRFARSGDVSCRRAADARRCWRIPAAFR